MPARGRSLIVACALLVLAACGGGRGTPAPEGGGSPDEPGFGPDVRLDTDPAGRELSLVPQICCEEERIYVVWYDRRRGPLDVYFNRSLDGGRTWLERDIRLDHGTGDSSSLIPRMCCAGDSVYVAWYDERNGLSDIYFNRSLDAGATWLAQDVRLDTDAPGAARSREPRLCCAGTDVCVVWFDDRDGSFDIYANRSSDGGSTWLAADVRVDRTRDSTTRAELPRVCCNGRDVVAAWVDERNGGRDVYCNRSTDGGATWAVVDQRLDTGPPSGAADAPVLACAGSRVYASWVDRRDGLGDIRLNASADGGATWLAEDVRLDGGDVGVHASLDPALCAEGDAAYVVWRDQRNGNDDVYFNRSLDGGATWLSSDRRLGDDLPGVNTAFDPGIACRDGRLCAVWRDDRNGRFDVFFTHSPDGGDAWSAPDFRMDTDDAGAAHSISPLICCNTTHAMVVWYDLRDGPGDVYFSRVALPGR